MATHASPILNGRSLYPAQQIRRYFLSPPTLQEVALSVLLQSLGNQYKWLVINLSHPVLMEPVYTFDGKAFKLTGHNSLTLVNALIERCATGTFVDYSGGTFLAQSPEPGSPLPLHVKNSDVEAAINERGPQLIERYQEALVNYWMERGTNGKARFLWLADTLKSALLVASGHPSITGEQLDMVISVVSDPDLTNGTKAYIVDQWGESGAINLEMLRGLVLVKEDEHACVVLLFTLSRGIQVFESLEKLGEWLVNLLTDIAPGHHMQWRLNQPKGNIFHSFSLTFLAKQLADIGAVLPEVRRFPSERRVLERALRVITSDFDSTPIDSQPLARLRAALPTWLVQADPLRQMEMAQYAMELAKTVSQPGWKPFDEGIPSLNDFADQALSAQLTKDYPDKPPLHPGQIKVRMDVDMPGQPPSEKPFWHLPPLLKDAVWSLPGFALLGLVGVDTQQLALALDDQDASPVWLTPEQAVTLINRANIGGAYSELFALKFKDPEQARWRQARFIEQQRLQLPMLALEYHLKFPQAFSRRAYESVVAVLQPAVAARRVDGQPVVLRPLAFKIGDAPVDKVRNLFVVGPRDVRAGPHVLYRPMAEVKLIEFPTWDAILAYIRQPGPVQYQVLAWLPEEARGRYLVPDVVVPGPQVFQSVDFHDSLWTDAAVTQSQEEVEGDYMEHLFNSAVAAMSSLPGAQSVDAMAGFWDWVRRFFGLGLMLLLSAYGGPAGRALGWLLVAWSATQDVYKLATDPTQSSTSSVVELLLDISLILLSRGRVSRPAKVLGAADTLIEMADGADVEASIEMNWYEPPEVLLEGGASSKVPQVQLPTEQGTSLLARGDLTLEQAWSGLYNRLSVIRQAELALYRVRAVPYAQRIHTGTHRGLYNANGNLYVEIAGDWFKVEDNAGVFRIVNDEMVGRYGPELQSTSLGLWSFVAEPPQPEDLQVALKQEQRRLFQLKDDEQQRLDLDAEYSRLSMMFDAQVFADPEALQGITHRYAEPGSRTLIDDELFKTDVTRWCAITLMDALNRRRQLVLVPDFNALSNKFSAAVVRARRNQVVLYSGKRSLMLMDDRLPLTSFDAPNLTDVVLSPATLRGVAAKLPQYYALQQKAIDASLDAEQRFEEMKRHGRIADTAVAALESSAWVGRRNSLKWQELQFRTLALLCFDASATCFRDATLDLIQAVTSLCSLKLMTWRELFTPGHFNLSQQVRVLNEVVDALVLASGRLSFQLDRTPRYIDSRALGNYRSFVRDLLQAAEQDLINVYHQYEAARVQDVDAVLNSGSKRIIDDALVGRVIGSRRSVVEEGEVQAYVDVFEAFDHRSIWTFKQQGTEGEPIWQEVPAPHVPAGNALPAHEQLANIGSEANRLWREAERQFTRLLQLEAFARFSPRLVRREWLNYASKMAQQADLLIDALKVPIASLKHQELLEFFKNTPSALYDEVMRFRQQASPARNRMIFRGAPTSDGLLTLYKEWLINVVETDSQDPLIRQFVVRERSSGRELWFARFFYNDQGARNIGYHFSQGLLLRYVDRNFSYKKLKQRASGNELLFNELLINVLRSNIDREVAETVFFGEDVSSAAP